MRIITIILTFWASTSLGQTQFQSIYDSLGVEGSTTIYDYKNKKWYFTDQQDAEIKSLPASTFKILNSLILLENKILKDENEIYKWDKLPKSHFGVRINAWEQDTDLKSAYQNSTVWFYEKASQHIKRDTYKKTLRKISYGNNVLNQEDVDFWNYGDFAISPKNQVEFLIKLYENKLPFSHRNIHTVKQLMVSENNVNYIFRDKTGWTQRHGKDIGWWVGYLETKENVFFFATRLTKDINEDNPNFMRGRMEVTKKILKEINSY